MIVCMCLQYHSQVLGCAQGEREEAIIRVEFGTYLQPPLCFVHQIPVLACDGSVEGLRHQQEQYAGQGVPLSRGCSECDEDPSPAIDFDPGGANQRVLSACTMISGALKALRACTLYNRVQ